MKRTYPLDSKQANPSSRESIEETAGNGGGRGWFHVERLDAYKVARELLVLSVRLSGKWPTGWSALRDQLKRAATSTLLNISEGGGLPKGSKSKARHFHIALGSAGEVAAALDAAAALGLSAAGQLEEARRLSCRLGALLGGLLRSVRRQQMASSRSKSS